MGEILTQEEVDSLLTGLSSGKVEAETDVGPEPGEVNGYDFTSQERVIRGRLPTFEVISERFGREIRSTLSNLLHTTVDISVESMDTLKFAEFGRSLPVPTSLHVFRMEPLRGHGLIVLESQLVFNLIDTFFGGKGSSEAKIEGREFTAIEDTMILRVVSECLEDLAVSWAPVEAIKTGLVRSEVNPQFASIVMPTDLVIVTKYEVELEQSAGTLIVCIPYSMIEPLRSKLSGAFQAEVLDIDIAWHKRLKEIIMESSIDFVAMLGKKDITGEQLVHMKVGDVIELEQDAEKPLFGLIEDLPKLTGYAGVQRGFQAFQVESKLNLE